MPPYTRLIDTQGLVLSARRLPLCSRNTLSRKSPHGNGATAVRCYSSNERSILRSQAKGDSATDNAPVMSETRREGQIPSYMKSLAAGVAFFVVATGGYQLGSNAKQQSQPDLSTASTLSLDAVPSLGHKPTEANLEAARKEFVGILGEENISATADELKSHSTSDWSSHPGDPSHRPYCVVYPQSTNEVSEVMKVCHKYRIPVTGFSGGTSLEGHFEPTRGGISVDFGRMDKILNLHKDDLDVVVQPAVGWQALNEELAEQDLFFPPDPGPGAMIGGMVGTGCSGTNAYRYGTMRDWVLSLTVVLADGTIIKTRQRPRKSSAGYDLTRLFIGSEGTLGLVTEATLKLTKLPQNTSVAVCSFPTVRDAANCVASVVDKSIPVAAMEVLNEDCMRMINDAGATSRQWNAAPTLFFKFSGSVSGVKEQIGQVQAIAKKAGSLGFDFAHDDEEREELWSARHEALWSLASTKKPDEHVWTTDVAVPVSRLPDAIEGAQNKLKESGLKGVIVGHVGDGNFHCFLLYNDKQRAIAEGFVHGMVDRALEAEGTITGEHGIGLVKRDFLVKELDEDTVAAMRKIKQAYDPLCLLNCDKVIRMQKPSLEDH